MAQGTKVMARWSPVLQSKFMKTIRKAFLVANVVFLSVLWLSATWSPTAGLRARLQSWGARSLARAYGVKPAVNMGIGDYWKKLHRTGHKLMRQMKTSLDGLRLLNVHRWAGHAARLSSGPVRLALRTRCLAWWRFFQLPHLPLHTRRFGKPWRWEAQLVAFYGESSTDDPMQTSVGWMKQAQDRALWKTEERAFVLQ